MARFSKRWCVTLCVALVETIARSESVTTTALQLYGLGNLRCAAYSPDGNYVATAGAAGAFLWNIQSGQIVRVFLGHMGAVTSVVFSSDGSRILTGSEDRTAKLWSASDGMLLLTFIGHAHHVHCVAFSPDGTQVLTSSEDRTVRLWSAEDGSVLRTFVHTQAVYGVAFSPTEAKIFTGDVSGTARLWSIATGIVLHTFSGLGSWHGLSVAFSPDGTQVLAGGGDGKARIWAVADGALLHTFSGHGYYGIFCVAFSHDGTRIVTASSDNTTKMWDVATTGLLRTFTGHAAEVASVAFSPDGTKVLTASSDETARLWHASSGAIVYVFPGHAKAVYCSTFAPGESQVLTGCSDGTVKVWNTTSGTVTCTMPVTPGNIESVAFSPDGTMVAMGVGVFNGVNLWRILDGTLLRSFAPPFWDAYWISFSPNGTRILAGGGWPDEVAQLWDVASGALLRTFSGHGADVYAVAFSPDGNKILTGSADDTAKLWDVNSTTPLRTFNGHTGDIYSVAFSPDGTKVLTGSADMEARMWNASNASLIRTFYHSSAVNRVAFSPDGTKILTGCADGIVEVWNASDGLSLHIFAGHTGPIYSVRFSADGRRVLSGSADGTARLWIAASAPSGGPAPPVVNTNNKVILVAGGGNYVGNPIVGQTQALADQAFFTCLVRGYAPTDIQYLSAFNDWRTRDSNHDGRPDADAQATAAAFWSAIDTWASDAGRLFLYFIDHGSYNGQTGQWSLRLNATEYITATALDSHLDGLQSRTGCDVILIVDCCYAGGFVQRCKATAGQRRLIFAATTPTNYSVFTPPKAADSFSSFFFSFAILGNSLANCFDWTQTIFQAMGCPAGQDPRATADGDDDWDKWDRAIARNYVLGSRPAFGLNAPTILSVATTQTVALGRPVTLWARLDVAVAAKEVWAVVIPPGIASTPGQPVTSLTRVNLTYVASLNRWQAVWSPGAAHRGRCRLVYFALSEDALKTRLLGTPKNSGLNVFATSVRIPWQLME